MKAIGLGCFIVCILAYVSVFGSGHFGYYADGNEVSLPLSKAEITVLPNLQEFISWDDVFIDYPELDAQAAPIPIPPMEFYRLHLMTGVDPVVLISSMRQDVRFLFVNPVFLDDFENNIYLGRSLLVKFKSVYTDNIDTILSQRGLSRIRTLADDPTLLSVRLEGGPLSDLLAVARELHESSLVVLAAPDFIVPFRPYLNPNDEYFEDSQYNLDSLDMAMAWDATIPATPLTLAVVDDGFDLYHEDISSDRWVDGYDYVSRSDRITEDERPPDSCTYCYHGMAVAGIIASETNNDSVGIASIAGRAGIKIMGQEVFNQYAYDSLVWASTGMIAWSIIDAVILGAGIVNISWGFQYAFGDCPPNWTDINAALDIAEYWGTLVVAAAGDTCTPQRCYFLAYPACYPTVLAVGALTMMDTIAYYSQRGPDLDLVAYGGLIPTTDRMGSLGKNPGGKSNNDGKPCESHDLDYFCYFEGTSASAAQVSGVAALILQKRPNFIQNAQYVDSMRIILRCSCEDPYGRAPEDTSRISDDIGWGRINAMRALTVVSRGDCNNNNAIEVGDIVCINNFWKGIGAPQPDTLMGDANCDGYTNLADAVYLVSYIYRGGPPPKAICCRFPYR